MVGIGQNLYIHMVVLPVVDQMVFSASGGKFCNILAQSELKCRIFLALIEQAPCYR